MLALTTIVLSVAVAVPLGAIAAWKAGSLIDRFVMLLSVGGFSVPVFVLGYILIYIVSMKLQLLPVQGYRSPFQGLGPFRSEEHTSELQSLMRISYAVFCLKKK